MAGKTKEEKKEDSLGEKIARVSLIFIFFSLIFGLFGAMTPMGKAAVVGGTIQAGNELGVDIFSWKDKGK